MAIDEGWLGLRPLRTHVVVCGYPRSGSTLLQLQLGTCVSDVRAFNDEAYALVAAQCALRNHSYMVTKLPYDIFFFDEIRAFYARHPANVRFILTARDPRAILTSTRTGIESGYHMRPSWWLDYYEHVSYAQQFADVVTVEYEDLVCRPAEVQRVLTEFIGWRVHRPFEQFHSAVPRGFRTLNLNGLRPLDPTRLNAWKHEQHRNRIEEVLREIPELPKYLIEMGYESDTSWVQDYL